MIERSTDARATYTLSTMMGQTVLSGSVDISKYRLDLKIIPAGIFILTIGQETFKIIKTE